MNEKLIFTCTWGRDEPERATLPFVAANIAATAGQEAIVPCTIEAVRLGCKGGSERVEASGLPKLDDLMTEFIANQGKVWLCGACAKPRGITQDQLTEGVTIVGAAERLGSERQPSCPDTRPAARSQCASLRCPRARLQGRPGSAGAWPGPGRAESCLASHRPPPP